MQGKSLAFSTTKSGDFAELNTANLRPTGQPDGNDGGDNGEEIDTEEANGATADENTAEAPKAKVEKSTKIGKNDPVLPDEIIDQQQIIDEITGQMTLF